MNASPSTIVSAAEHALSSVLVLEQEAAEPAEQHTGADEDDGEAGTNSSAPATSRPRRVGASAQTSAPDRPVT